MGQHARQRNRSTAKADHGLPAQAVLQGHLGCGEGGGQGVAARSVVVQDGLSRTAKSVLTSYIFSYSLP